ncbi:MAG: SsrA-binding protein SmpB [Candidatus Wallbacteria bacterium]|nr:SsrA-binding protein SmpB [Candidatus Wallbacteria bacterium]
MKTGSVKIVSNNRKAFYNYEITEKFEAGLVLMGTEIKALRQGKVSLLDSFAHTRGGELFLYEMNISHYDHGNRFNHDPKRERKLLLHKHEIRRLLGKIKEKGMTLVPLKIYLKNGLAKVELGLGRGKKVYDKKETIKNRIADRETSRMMKDRRND